MRDLLYAKFILLSLKNEEVENWADKSIEHDTFVNIQYFNLLCRGEGYHTWKILSLSLSKSSFEVRNREYEKVFGHIR